MKRWLLLAALLLAVSTDARSPRGAPFPGLVSVAGLHVVGNLILNSAGQVVPLRGVNQDGGEYECLSSGSTAIFDFPATSAEIIQLQSWAIDVVRLPINESCWLGINGEPAATYNAAAYQSGIEAYVTLLTAANIATIIDLQWVGPGTDPANPNLGGGLLAMPDNDHAPAFWTSVANAFKSNSSVIFDLYNEPHPDNNADSTTAWTCLLSGGTASFCSTNDNNAVPYTPVGMQSLLTTIRATGSTNILMVPGISYENVMTQWLTYKPTDSLTPAQIVAGWHSYQGQTCGNTTCFNTYIAPVLASVPLIAGEIGENDCADDYIDPLMTFLDAHNGNYLAWAFNTYACGSFPALISDYPTSTPTAFGVDFRSHLLTLVGRTVPPPPVVPFFNNATFPYGIRVGYTGGSNYTASDSTVYYPDVAASGLTIDTTTYGFSAFTTADTITGTSDPTLFATGRQGQAAIWTFGVPNGTYYVTLGMAPNTTYTAGSTGQNQLINGTAVANCIWSSNPLPGGCGNVQTNPVVDTAYTVEYTVNVFGQAIAIEPEAAGTHTILNSIKISTTP